MKYVQIRSVRHWWYHILDQGSITRALTLCLFQVLKFSTRFAVFIPTQSSIRQSKTLKVLNSITDIKSLTTAGPSSCKCSTTTLCWCTPVNNSSASKPSAIFCCLDYWRTDSRRAQTLHPRSSWAYRVWKLSRRPLKQLLKMMMQTRFVTFSWIKWTVCHKQLFWGPHWKRIC